MNTTIEARLRAIAAELESIFPQHHIDLTVQRYFETPSIDISVFGLKSYAEATEFFRSLGIGDRAKSVYNDHEPRTVLKGKLSEEITLTAYCSGLPPSCRIENFVERVPKTQTVESASGEFIEVSRTRVVCGREQPGIVA
jgi:hypothetical protein